VGIVDVAGLEPRQEVHLCRLHETLQPPIRNVLVADEDNLLHAGLFALVDLEHEIVAAGGQLHETIGHRHVIAADLLVGVLDALDVGVRDRLAEGAVALGLHLDGELVALQLAVAFKSDAIENLAALDDVDDDDVAADARRDLAEHAGGRQIGHRAVDAALVGSGEIALDLRDIAAAGAIDDNL